ncbi:MAG TPA: PKD domain-containing protein, partial [Thermoanaerobaculia bacterium]|nr:PKD domain-containing protein [Thermoanaerobaculia bacterium]
SPSTGISSSRLAEILAHEFGHTLGFGHSSDNNALMYASITGLGPSLRSDDQLGARWLYPGAGATLQPPPAPTELFVSALSSSSIRLRWRDNSSNETKQTIYMGTGSGSRTHYRDIGANVESFDVTGLAAGTTYSFHLTASNGEGESSPSNVDSAATSAEQTLTASFNVSPTSGTAGSTVFQFTDTSTGPVSSRLWTFGDGQTSNQQNPSHVYSGAGTYTARLVVSSSSGQQSSATRSISVSGGVVRPVAAFDVSASTITAGQTVSFSDRSSGSPTSWTWSFGDGGSSSQQHPSHTYTSAGTFTATLTARNSAGSSTTSRIVTVSRATTSFQSLVPVSTQVGGAGGTLWRTDLTIFNASSMGLDVRVHLIPSVGGTPHSRSVWLGPSRLVSWDNVLRDLFGLPEGAGALRVEATSTSGTPDLRVTSRTYTNSSRGTYGQFVDDLPSETIPSKLYITGIEMSAAARSNLGFVNRSGHTVTSTLTLYASSGSVLDRRTMQFSPMSFQQQSAASLFPILGSGSFSSVSLEISSDGPNALTGYVSVADNVSQDPVYIAARGADTSPEIFIPAVGRTSGAAGTYWRSDVTLFNPGSASVSISLRFLRAGADNRGAAPRSISLGARDTHTLRDVVTWLGGGENSGALQITWSGGSGMAPVVTSRTYTTRAGDSGTLGQAIDAVSQGGFGARSIITGLTSNAHFRTNLGFVNRGDQPISITVWLVAADGTLRGSSSLGLPARSQGQTSAAALFPSVNFGGLGDFTVVAESSRQTMFAYGSVVDNLSGDPIFVSGQ